MHNMLNFIINKDENFIINLYDQNDTIHCCYQSRVSLFLGDQEVIIGKSIIADFAKRLQENLKLVLSNDLKIHCSIEQNIGYYWNQYLNKDDDPHLYLKEDSTDGYWIGLIYLLWTTDSCKKNQQFATWLYNDKEGNIVFEVTPTYSDTFIDPQDPLDVKAYEEWMNLSYKSFFTKIISHDVARQWLKQANLILKTIEDNVKILEKDDGKIDA